MSNPHLHSGHFGYYVMRVCTLFRSSDFVGFLWSCPVRRRTRCLNTAACCWGSRSPPSLCCYLGEGVHLMTVLGWYPLMLQRGLLARGYGWKPHLPTGASLTVSQQKERAALRPVRVSLLVFNRLLLCMCIFCGWALPRQGKKDKVGLHSRKLEDRLEEAHQLQKAIRQRMRRNWFSKYHSSVLGFPCSSVGKESACSAGVHLQCRRRWFDPWVGKIPWRRKW